MAGVRGPAQPGGRPGHRRWTRAAGPTISGRKTLTHGGDCSVTSARVLPPTPAGHRSPHRQRPASPPTSNNCASACGRSCSAGPGELAPQLLALTAADTPSTSPAGSGAASACCSLAASAAGLTHLVRQSRQVQVLAEQSLVDSLGEEYVERPGERPARSTWRPPAEAAEPLRRRTRGPRRQEPSLRDAGKRGLLDIYRPADREVVGAPVLIQVHGGGWTLGSKDEQGIPLMQRMAARGWVCVAINYRLARAPRSPTRSST